MDLLLKKFHLRLDESATVNLVPDRDDAVIYKGPKNLRLFRVGTLKYVPNKMFKPAADGNNKTFFFIKLDFGKSRHGF